MYEKQIKKEFVRYKFDFNKQRCQIKFNKNVK